MPLVEEGGVKTTEALLEQIKQRFSYLIRPCWTPVCFDKNELLSKKSEGSNMKSELNMYLETGVNDTRLLSKFGGVEPWLDPNVGWPRCPRCKKAKTFLCQLLIKNLSEYIKDMLDKTDGMFRCFACLKCKAFAKEGYCDDIAIVDESRLQEPFSLKFMAAIVVNNKHILKHRNRTETDDIPKELIAYLDSMNPEQEPESDCDLNEVGSNSDGHVEIQASSDESDSDDDDDDDDDSDRDDDKDDDEYDPNRDGYDYNDDDGNDEYDSEYVGSDEEESKAGPDAKRPKMFNHQAHIKAEDKVMQFPEKFVARWCYVHGELPYSVEMEDYGSRILEVIDINSDVSFGDLMYSWDETIGHDLICTSVKVGGHFPWYQVLPGCIYKRYPDCKDCHAKMNQLMLLLDFNDDVLWHKEWESEDGVLFVSVCPKCKRPQLNLAKN